MSGYGFARIMRATGPLRYPVTYIYVLWNALVLATYVFGAASGALLAWKVIGG